MVSKNLTLFLLLWACGLALTAPAQAQYSAPKMKMGVADANEANLSAEPKSLINRADRLLEGEQQGLLKKDLTKEWRLGYCFQAWFIMTVQYRSLKGSLSPDEAEACTNCITTFGQKFRRAQKELAINDDQLLEALGKSPTLPETYSAYWPAPLP